MLKEVNFLIPVVVSTSKISIGKAYLTSAKYFNEDLKGKCLQGIFPFLLHLF
jgi:hypothetical protein